MKWAFAEDATLNPNEVKICKSPTSPQQFFDMLVEIKHSMGVTPDIVVIGFPGPIGVDGRLSVASTLWPGQNISSLNLPSLVRDVWPCAKTGLINDVSSYGHYLVEHGESDFCVINIGSGIGCKVFVGGTEMLGIANRGGEIGHWVTPSIDSDIGCDCGELNHVGAISSGRGVLRYVVAKSLRNPLTYKESTLSKRAPSPHDISSEDLVKSLQENDYFVVQAISEAMKPLGQAAALIHLAIGCERFFLVGGFASAIGDTLPTILQEHSRSSCWDNGFNWNTAYMVLPNQIEASIFGLLIYGARYD